METRKWNCGTQCEMKGVPLVCLFHNPILVINVAPLELGLGIHNPRFFAGPLEVGLGTRNARSTMINRSTVFALHFFALPCVPVKMQGVGLLDFTLGYSTIGYLTFLFLTLPCPGFRAFSAAFAVCPVGPKFQIPCSDYYSVHKDEWFCL